MPTACCFRRLCDFLFIEVVADYTGHLGLTFLKGLVVWIVLGWTEVSIPYHLVRPDDDRPSASPSAVPPRIITTTVNLAAPRCCA